METRLIIVRHGASHHKEDGVVGGISGCRGLTELGRHQAERLATRLAAELPVAPTAIYSSILPRAIETAELLAAALGRKHVVQDCGLCTWHSPAYADGLSVKTFQQHHRQPGGGAHRPFEEGNESWSELVIRTGRTFETLASRHAGETILVVTHSECVKSSLIVFGNLPLVPAFDIASTPTGITEWFTDGDPDAWPRPRWTLLRLNDSAHLTPNTEDQLHKT